MRHRIAIVACARWESEYIVEWLTYYRYIGVSHVYLYCNDDDPQKFYSKILPFSLGENPFVTFFYFPYQGQQYAMYRHFLEGYSQECEWVSFIDVDEFVRLEDGCNDINEFISKYEEIADSIMLNWVFFGPNGFKNSAPESIIKELDKRQDVIHPYTKHFTKVDLIDIKKLENRERANAFWHNPHLITKGECKVINAIGDNMNNYYEGFPSEATKYVDNSENKAAILSATVINHYAFRSEAAFHDRFRRGLKGAFSGQGMWRDLADSPDFQVYIDASNAVLDDRLSLMWADVIVRSHAANVVPLPSGRLISREATASQSSTSEMSEGRTANQDAARALSDDFDEKPSFHTGYSLEPWWEVVFPHEHRVCEVRVFNRIDYEKLQRDNSLINIYLFDDEGNEKLIYSSPPESLIGGVDGRPLIVTVPNLTSRRVRIYNQNPGYLSLCHIEIYACET